MRYFFDNDSIDVSVNWSFDVNGFFDFLQDFSINRNFDNFVDIYGDFFFKVNWTGYLFFFLVSGGSRSEFDWNIFLNQNLFFHHSVDNHLFFNVNWFVDFSEFLNHFFDVNGDFFFDKYRLLFDFFDNYRFLGRNFDVCFLFVHFLPINNFISFFHNDVIQRLNFGQ